MAQWTLNYTTYDNSQWTSVVGNIGASGGEFKLYNLPWTQENLPNFKDIELNIGTVENLATWRIDNSGISLDINEVWPNIQTANIYNTEKVTNIKNMFCNCRNLINIVNMDTSNITDMEYMFWGCDNLTTVPNFDTSNVIDMSSMFSSCDNLTIVPNFDTSNVRNMRSMFYWDNLINVPNFDTSNVTDMVSMFYACSSLINIPNFNTSNVTNMKGMLSDCYSLTAVPNLDTSNVTNMGEMLKSCRNLTNIPNFNTSKVTNMSQMFFGCYNLAAVPNLDTSNVTNMQIMFLNCRNLINIPNFNTSNVQNISNMFRSCFNLSNQSLRNIARSLPNVSQLTSQNSNLQNIGLSQNQINYISTTKYASQLQARGWNIEDNYVKPDLVKSLKMKQSDGTMNLAMLGTNAEYVDMEDGTTLEDTIQDLKQYIDDNVANILGGMY